MGYIFFAKPLLLSMIMTFVLLGILIKGIDLSKLPDFRSSGRHLHKKGVIRFGGVAIILAFSSTLLLDHRLVITQQIVGVIFACLIILVVGVIDDIAQLSWKIQIILQVLAVAVVFFFGIHLDYVTNPLGGIISFAGQWGRYMGFFLAALWVIFLMNALNWVDGIDGLSGGITAIGAASIFFLSMRADVNQPPVAIISVALVGNMLAFLLFNFYPAKIIAGTSGSMFMGFILGILGIFAGAKIATTALVMVVPLIDACWVIYERLRSGKSIFLADKRHLHHRLMQLGWSQKKICLVYYVITATVAAVALNSDAAFKAIFFFLLAVALGSALMIIRKKTATNEA
jgi:UDP-GlcNAc:undecaprenyl-phosphate GlcNAc-1-phosphate transferase